MAVVLSPKYFLPGLAPTGASLDIPPATPLYDGGTAEAIELKLPDLVLVAPGATPYDEGTADTIEPKLPGLGVGGRRAFASDELDELDDELELAITFFY